MRASFAIPAVLVLGCGAAEDPLAPTREAPSRVQEEPPRAELAVPGSPTSASKEPRRCTTLGSGCANGTFDMCCAGSACDFTFTDGSTFATLDEALAHCARSASSPAPLDPPAPDPNDPNLGGTGGGTGGSSASSSGSGSGSTPAGQCYGSVEACQARFGPSDCRENPGCYYDWEECRGVADSCQSFYSPSGCGYQLGCYWSYNDNRCLGASASCSSRGSSGGCHAQSGCYWHEGGCRGSAWPCSSISSEGTCDTTIGCYWR